MVRRIYVEKKFGLRQEADNLCRELQSILNIDTLVGVRMVNRYDTEGLDEQAFLRAVKMVFSEPQVDNVFDTLPVNDTTQTPSIGADAVFAVESLPGQFDQRADSAEACIQLMTQQERPTVRTAKIYLLSGRLTEEDVEKIKHYVINPVESREATLDLPDTLQIPWDLPPMVETVTDFIKLDEEALSNLLNNMGLAMDLDDLRFLQTYFRDEEHRDPTVTEIKVVDTYWSDHCRHTTFSTCIDNVEIVNQDIYAAYEQYLNARKEIYGEKTQRPQTLMDIATIGTKILKRRGLLKNLDESEEINACSIHTPVTVNDEEQDWLLMFKNETHNHPTEIEPFGGAATCIGGCIRDPLSGRAYVYQAMRITGCGDPRVPVHETLPGKLPQRKLAQTAAAGYSSYGNQIGLSTGMVSELYHPGYIAKHMEVGVVVGAAPTENVVRQRPTPGDIVILLGGRTGRDGIGGATGSSKTHNQDSLSTMASEVQKGNAPEERKIQRLFHNSKVTKLIKRCNDFGAGGVSVAVGELANGLEINLDTVRKKYEGLDGTELAISESQERMAVVVAPENVAVFIKAAEEENLEAYPVATVTESPRMIMRWRGENIVNLSRAFLNTNGATKRTSVYVPAYQTFSGTNINDLRTLAASLETASRRGLAERFDSTVGAGSVLMPFGGKYQRTPTQVMAALLPVLPEQETENCSVMAWGFHPYWMETNPFTGAQAGVILSLAKLVASGCDYQKAYFTFQEYFEKLRQDPERWGKPFSALLGALDIQLNMGIAAIGGKDSMSGSFLDMNVPPTLISFAIAPSRAGEVLSPEFKEPGHPVYLFGLSDDNHFDIYKEIWEKFHELCTQNKVRAAWAIENGVADAIMKMSFGNRIGFRENENTQNMDIPWYNFAPGMIVAEMTENIPINQKRGCRRIGITTAEQIITINGESVPIQELLSLNEDVLESVYPNRTNSPDMSPPPVADPPSPLSTFSAPKISVMKPKVLIPVFPGSNCEYDSERIVRRAGLDAEIFVINNQTPQGVADSAKHFAKSIHRCQIIFIPGGFSGGDEPDGSGKFITAFFRNPQVSDATHDLLKTRDGLMLGICNGFQALIKLGLVPYGEILDTDENSPTLSYNVIGRHQSKIVRTRIASTNSPWLSHVNIGDVINVPISHGEGRFLCSEELLKKLQEKGQIATQYVDLDDAPTMDIDFNPNGSVWAVEGILSPDGRIFGKMGHSERIGTALYRNVPGQYDLHLFQSAKDYFSS